MIKAATRRLTTELSELSDAQLAQLEAAAGEVLAQLEKFGNLNSTPVGQLLEGAREFTEDAHYPDGDVHDEGTGSQYYYHAHRGSETENGHFHLFVRASAIPARMRPAFTTLAKDRPTGNDAIAHLVAISIGHDSLPFKLFTTNQWVTGETFYGAADTSELASRFNVTSDLEFAETSHWVSAVVALFQPQIRWLLSERDDRIAAWARQYPSRDALTDEELEITSDVDIDIDVQIASIDAEVAHRKKSRRKQNSKVRA